MCLHFWGELCQEIFLAFVHSLLRSVLEIQMNLVEILWQFFPRSFTWSSLSVRWPTTELLFDQWLICCHKLQYLIKLSRQMSISILVQRQWAFITFIDWKAMSIYIWNSLKLLWRWLPYWKYLLTGIMALTFLTPQLTSSCAPRVIGPSIKFNYFLKLLL